MANNFWQVLFDDRDKTCATDTPYGITLSFVDYCAGFKTQYFSINPMHQSRADANVTTFRNILLEFDKLTLENQMTLIISQLPFASQTFSGNKSYHAIISLETPAKNRAEYDELVKRVYARFPDADPANKNPSRLSRTPGAIRDNGNLQRLQFVGKRISQAEFDSHFPKLVEEPKAPKFISERKLIPVGTLSYIRYGSEPGRRNQDLFVHSCELFRHGYTFLEVLELTAPISDLTLTETKRTIKSAQKAVERE